MKHCAQCGAETHIGSYYLLPKLYAEHGQWKQMVACSKECNRAWRVANPPPTYAEIQAHLAMQNETFAENAVAG